MPRHTEPSANNAAGGLLAGMMPRSIVRSDHPSFDEETYAGVRRLAAKWCAEPSVHGGKGRPGGSGLVV